MEEADFLNRKMAQLIPVRTPTVQDKDIVSLFTPVRLLELTKYFVLFDYNVKKICRYQQYFAVKEILHTVKQRDEIGNRGGGVIWQTNGIHRAAEKV